MRLVTIVLFLFIIQGCGGTDDSNSSSVADTTDSLHILENTSPDTNIGSIVYSSEDGSYISYIGRKDNNGNLLYVNNAILGVNKTEKTIKYTFDHFYRVTHIEFSSGNEIYIDDFNEASARAAFHGDNQRTYENLIFSDESSEKYYENKGFSYYSKKPSNISDLHYEVMENPKTTTLCRKRTGSFKLNSTFINNIIFPKSLSTIISNANQVVQTSSSLANEDLNEIKELSISNAIKMIGGENFLLAIKAAQCSQNNDRDCISELIKDELSGISPITWQGDINQCNESETIDSYLYARCAGEVKTESQETPICEIPAGGKAEVVINFYKPDSFVNEEVSSTLSFAYDGPFTIPNEFDIDVSKSKQGVLYFEAVHQDSDNLTDSGCHTTAGYLRNSSANLWGLAISSERAGGGGVIRAQNYPATLEFITMGTNQAYIVGVEIPCNSYMVRTEN